MTAREVTEAETAREVDGEHDSRRAPEPSPVRRLLIVTFALILAIAGIAFTVGVAFRPDAKLVTDETPAEASPMSVEPLRIRVWTTSQPSDLHIAATFGGEEIHLDAIETPGPDLEYPMSSQVSLPVGTPFVVESWEGSVSVFELAPARGEVVVDGSCIVPGALEALPGPAETAFFIYVEGNIFSGGQAFRAATVGAELVHDSALDAGSVVDAYMIGLAVCEGQAPGGVTNP